MTKHIRLDGVIPGILSGLRADQALAKIFPQHSRARIQEWIRAGAATLDGAAVRAKDRVVGGERISILCAVASDDRSAAQPGPLAVLYDDPDLLALDKPPGLVVHPGAGNRDGTLLNRLLAYDPGLRAIPRAGLVHRLDKNTSGLMLIARSLHAHTRLVAQIKAREVERVYEAVVTGSPPPRATVEAPIGRDRARRTRMAVEVRGKHAVDALSSRGALPASRTTRGHDRDRKDTIKSVYTLPMSAIQSLGIRHTGSVALTDVQPMRRMPLRHSPAKLSMPGACRSATRFRAGY